MKGYFWTLIERRNIAQLVAKFCGWLITTFDDSAVDYFAPKVYYTTSAREA